MDLLRNIGLVVVLMLCTSISNCSLNQDIQSARKTGNSLNFLVVGDGGREGLYNQSQVAVQTQWYSVLGNHDYRGDALAQLSPTLRNRDPRWYCERSFILKYSIHPLFRDFGWVDFFFVDTTPFVDTYWEPSKHTYDWRGIIPRKNYIQQQLQDLTNALEASKATWKIVVGHHAIRTIGSHGDTTELIQQLLPILEAYGVDVYMNGHDHCLEHISSLNSPLEFLTSGGGSKAWRGINKSADMKVVRFFHDGQGFMSVQITPTSLHATFHDVDGKSIHQLDLLKDQYNSY